MSEFLKNETVAAALAWLTGGDATLIMVAQVFLVVLFTAIANFTVRRLFGRLERRTRTTRTHWDDSLVVAARKPAAFLVWVLGLTFAVRVIYETTSAAIFTFYKPVQTVCVIVGVTWFLLSFIRNVQGSMLSRAVEEAATEGGATLDPTTIDAIGKLLRISVLITASLIGLQSLGFSISGVLAFGGVGGIAVGFAARDLLANFFGGLMVYLDRPFAIGDWVRSPDRNIEGTVEDIGWRVTCIRTFDKRPLYVPNAVFTQVAIENPSRMSHRRIYETIGVRYDDFALIDKIVTDIKAMLRSHPQIAQDQTMIVNFNQFGASSLDIMIYTFTRTTQWIRYHEIKQDVLLKIGEIIERHGAEIAFPTSTVLLPDGVHLKPEAPVPGGLPVSEHLQGAR